LQLIPTIETPKQQEDSTYKYQSLNLTASEQQPSLVKEDFVDYLNQLVENKQRNPEQQGQEDTPTLVMEETNALPRLEYIGQFMGTYLLAQNEQGLYIVDQHAAAERIRYERYRTLFGGVDIERQTLLLPMTLALSNQEVLAITEKLDQFEPLGVKAIPNDYNGIDILEVPSWFPNGHELSYTEEIAKFILDDKDVTVGDVRNALAINLSCKHSIKANHYINPHEINKLLSDLSNCENPYTCPHGRPVIIHFTVTEIEKWFKRIQS
jgi:DNA mismatch repair protein MutL